MDKIELNEDILLSVTRPARYIGEEHNMVKKEWSDSRIKFCFCYPDTYEVGMSHLGLKILYHILNGREDVLCERSFAPWFDMEKVMLDKKIPLFSLESKMPLRSFDIIGFSFQYELTYTNFLNMLHLSGIPLLSQQRANSRFPLIIGGGPCVFNPEPLADFVDLFLIGDGEEAITEILDIYKSFKLSRVFDTNAGRELLLGQMSKIEGVYVPSLYKPTYSGNSLSAITPRSDETSSRVKKRTIKKLGLDHFPTEPIVPFISTIHDRITLEIMKGCMHSCRFCQARNIYSPVRIREVDELLKLADQTFKKTGFDEISLVSLSSWSYPYIEELIKELSNIFTSRGVNISLPSLRIDENIDRLPSLINTVRKSGLTFAPEVGSERMLKVINKNIDYERFFKAIKVAYEKGWSRVKLYFMIGLPFEEAADIEAIIELADKVALLRKEVSGYPAEVVINVSSFIPKPHTSFQWFGMASFDELREKQDLLIKKSARKRYLKLKMHDIDASILEAVFSRGDRRLASVLLEAWGNGCRFDAWSESLNMKGWEEAFSKSGIDKGYYLRRLGLDEVLAWEHIFCGIEKECLLLDYRKACE